MFVALHRRVTLKLCVFFGIFPRIVSQPSNNKTDLRLAITYYDIY